MCVYGNASILPADSPDFVVVVNFGHRLEVADSLGPRIAFFFCLTHFVSL